MKVLLGGGSGLVGSAVRKLLIENGHKVTLVSRTSGKDKITWDEVEKNGLPECDAVVSLSGEPILNPAKKFDDKLKQEIRDSRIKLTRILANAIEKATTPPKVFLSFSATGYYPPSEDADYTEDSPGGKGDFLTTVCGDWEKSATLSANCSGVRSVIVRCGVVLAKEGGVIQANMWPFWLGLGGRIGSGRQWLPWIHVADVVGIVVYGLENPAVTGVLNAVAPQVATNADYTREFAAALWRPAIIPMPAFFYKWLFGPERAVILLEGQKVIPKRTLELGYSFKFPDLKLAMADIVSSK